MKRIVALLLGLVIVGAIVAPSARMDVGSNRDPEDLSLFQFVRIQYNGYMLGSWGRRGSEPPWAHDYPKAERNFLKILSELTSIETTERSHKVLRMHDADIMDYPFLYVSEPGYWDITEPEVQNLRKYLDRGGFVLFDDFRGQRDWGNLVNCMRQVYPERGFRKLTVDEPVFQCFYNIDDLDLPAPYRVPGEPAFYGIFDDTGRLQVVAAYNNDIGDYWEWSDDNFTPIELSNEAYKFGINFVLYALTH